MRDPVKVIELKKSILEDNDADAEVLRGTLKDEKLLYINIMSSPGSGKTTTLSAVINRLKDEMRIGVMEADIDSDVDAKTIADLGVKSIQLHTGGMCHLDAEMSRQGMREMGTEDLDVVFLENVGNLVCPAEFDTGSAENVVILSVPEGDDKPLKYPLVFTKCNVVLVNKGWKVKQNSHWTNSEVDGINASIDKNGAVSFALAGAKSSPSEEFNKTMLTYTAMFTEMARIAAAAYNPSSSGVAAAKTAEPAQTVVNVQPAAAVTTSDAQASTNAVESVEAK